MIRMTQRRRPMRIGIGKPGANKGLRRRRFGRGQLRMLDLSPVPMVRCQASRASQSRLAAAVGAECR